MARKIAIYALCKNEIKNVEAWYESCRDADCIVVTDTGSTDGSRERLATLPLKVCDLRVLPWRFDDAFNAAMNNLPDDVDIILCHRIEHLVFIRERLTGCFPPAFR